MESQPSDFNFPWSDALIPIGPNYLAVERAIYECAFAGCETIWVVCSKETTPLIRHRIGDWILDPVISAITMDKLGLWNIAHRLKQIPIFYIPIHPKDKQKRSGLAWSILHGHNRAKHISRMFSRWTTPSKYYVSFPHGVYWAKPLKPLRPIISCDKSMYLSCNGKTAKDGELLAFTFDSNEFVLLKKAYREEEQLLWKSGLWQDGKFTGEMLPREQRYTGRFVSLKTLMKYIDVQPESTHPIMWYHDISTWAKYCQFLGSQYQGTLKRPKIFKYHEFNAIGEDIDYDEELDEIVEVVDSE